MCSLLTVIVLSNCFFIIGTAKNSQQPTQTLEVNPVPVLERYFSRSLYQRLSLESGGGNLLVSPLGVDVLLATLLEGSQGGDRLALTRVLGLDQINGFYYSRIKDGYRQLLKNVNSLLQITTKMYIDKAFVLNKDFLTIAKDYYKTGVETLDFANTVEAARTINSSVKKNSNNTVSKVITEGDLAENSTMVCTSIVHLQDYWAQPFPGQITSKQVFRSSPQTQSLVNMMHVKNKFHFVWDATFHAKILALELKPKNISMMIILPDKEDELFDLEARFATEDYVPLLRLVQSVPPVNVDLRMPRFTLHEDLDLGETLKKMGLTNLFTQKADLSGISCCGGLHVSKIKQKSHFVVGENGVEASSTSVVEATYGNDNWQEFYADHPFLFFLVVNDIVVFQGRVVQP